MVGQRRTPARLALAVVALGVVLGLSACGVTDPATSITENGATLNGRVHPRSGSTTWWFEYGQTAAYGAETERLDAGTAGELVPVSSRVTGLTPGTTYHFRTCAQRTGDPVACGEDRSFTTSSGRLPPGFQESIAFSGLTEPLALRFAADGRVFVAEKRGIVKVFDGVGDATPEVFADLRTQVQSVWDRGLLGLALDPDFPAKPFVYVLYTHDAAIGGTAPRWGDGCPEPAGPDAGRLRRERPALAADGRRQRHVGPRAGARGGLVPAVPVALGRLARLRPGRVAVRVRRRRRRVLHRGLRAVQEPLRRPAR